MYLRHETGMPSTTPLNCGSAKTGRRPRRFSPLVPRRLQRESMEHDYVRHLHRAGMYHYAQKHPTRISLKASPCGSIRSRAGAPLPRLAGRVTKLEYVDRIIDLEAPAGALHQPTNRLAGSLQRDQGNRRRVLRHQPCTDPDLAEYRKTCSISSPGAPRAARITGCVVRGAFHSATSAPDDQQAGRLDRRFRPTRDRQVPAPAPGPVYLRAPGRAENRRNEKLVDLTIVATWHVSTDSQVKRVTTRSSSHAG